MTPVFWFVAGFLAACALACALPWLVDRLLIWCGLDGKKK